MLLVFTSFSPEIPCGYCGTINEVILDVIPSLAEEDFAFPGGMEEISEFTRSAALIFFFAEVLLPELHGGIIVFMVSDASVSETGTSHRIGVRIGGGRSHCTRRCSRSRSIAPCTQRWRFRSESQLQLMAASHHDPFTLSSCHSLSCIVSDRTGGNRIPLVYLIPPKLHPGKLKASKFLPTYEKKYQMHLSPGGAPEEFLDWVTRITGKDLKLRSTGDDSFPLRV